MAPVDPNVRIWDEEAARWITQAEFDAENARKAAAVNERRIASGLARQQAHNSKVAAEAARRKIAKLALKRAKLSLDIQAIDAEIAQLEHGHGLR